MDLKKIMIIAFLVLAIFSIASVSAADDLSGDVNASDDSEAVLTAVSDYEGEDYEIDVWDDEEMCTNESDEDYYEDSIVDISLPVNANGSFQILNGDEVVANSVVNVSDDDDDEEAVWYIDEDDNILYGSLYLTDLDFSKINDGDKLTFVFKDETDGIINSLTVIYKVTLTETTIKFSSIDYNIKVNNANTTDSGENFTYVSVSKKEGYFIIYVEDDKEDEIAIFKKDLSDSSIPYVETGDEDNPLYTVAFSLSDINSYISSKTDYNNFTDLIDKNKISSGSVIDFGIYEDENGENYKYSVSFTWTLSNGVISFSEEDEDEDKDVDVDYLNSDITMDEGWNNTEVLQFKVRNGTSGKIVIYLNDDANPAYNKTLSELSVDDSDDEYNYYNITINDLNITKAGNYTIKDYFYDENNEILYQYDSQDPEVISVYESQSATVGNVTIQINPVPVLIYDNESIITVGANASAADKLYVYADGSETPINITLGEKDDDGNYTIVNSQLRLGAGEHTLTVSYNGTNLTGNVIILSNIEIGFADDGEIVYTSFNDGFAYIAPEDEDDDIQGIDASVNLTIADGDGNVVFTSENDITSFSYYEDSGYVICTDDASSQLNGTYKVTVTYIDEYGGEVKAESNITFKPFDSEDYGTSVKDTITDANDYAVTFTNVSGKYVILVNIDGNLTEFDEEYISKSGNVYYIQAKKLNGLSEGPHSIIVSLEAGNSLTVLANETVIVDLEENFDLNLSVSASDIEAGSTANIVITANSTFTGDITVEVAGANYTVSVVNGQGTLSLPGLTAGTYNATASFKSDGIFSSAAANATFKVTAKAVTPTNTVKLTLKKAKVKKSAKKLKLKATLKINGKAVKGKKLTFKFKNKKYTAKTNKKGVAKVTIKKKVLKKLKKGKKVKYSVTYGSKTVKKTAKVKK